MTSLDVPLTPLRFLERANEISPQKTAIIDGERRWTYADFADEVQRLAKALRDAGVAHGQRVAYLAGNSAEMLIAHYAVPLAGGVLVAINTRLAAAEVNFICTHSGAELLFGDEELLSPLLSSGLEFETVRQWIFLPGIDGERLPAVAGVHYVDFLMGGRGSDIPWSIENEHQDIAINYTSGTTGRPKGVLYSHRGAFLSSLGGVHHSSFDASTKYLWTLPMFHCNGWCTTWAVTAALGTHVCLRSVRADTLWSMLDEHQITHLNGAPTVLAILAHAEQAHTLKTPLTISSGGAPPSPTIIATLRALGASVVHIYGLTETYGPYTVCEPQPDWTELDDDRRAQLMARQGVGLISGQRVRVVREELSESGQLVDVEADGREIGEIVMRGNGVMKGYHDDEEGTREATVGGWFHSGDLGVMHPDNYVQLVDRAKDVVISGGENISTIEVEHAIMSHPGVLEVAVVSTPDDKWGERPKAFVVTVPGCELDAATLVAHVRARIASYKTPRVIDFVSDLPKTSTGKVRKNELRDNEWKSNSVKVQG